MLSAEIITLVYYFQPLLNLREEMHRVPESLLVGVHKILAPETIEAALRVGRSVSPTHLNQEQVKNSLSEQLVSHRHVQ